MVKKVDICGISIIKPLDGLSQLVGLQGYLLHTVIGSNLDTYPDRTPMFEWGVVNVDIRTDTKTQNMSLKEVGLRASNLLII